MTTNAYREKRKTTTRRWGEKLTSKEEVAAKQAFLTHFSTEEPIVERACAAANVSRTTYHRWMEHDEEFALLCEQAKQAGDDLIRAEIYRRGVKGFDEPVFYQGAACGTIRKYSDQCLLKLAAARMREFREKDAVQQGDERVAKAYSGFESEEV